MQHPFIQNKKKLYYYFIAWIPISGIYAIAVSNRFKQSLSLSVLDAGISLGIFSLVGFLSWYTVRFISIDSKRISLVVFSHISAAFVFISIWHLLSYALLTNCLHDTRYLQFLSSAIPFRIIIGLFLYCLLALSYYVYKYYVSFKSRIEKDAEWKTLVKEGELNLLKSQLQPHFIFNSLNSIHALMNIDAERAQQMLLILASYLRLSIEKNQEKIVPLSEELENSELYCSIEKIRFQDRLIIHKNIHDETPSLLVPHMILQPLLENAIKHGLFESTEIITIQINTWLDGKLLHISIQNNHDTTIKKKHGNNMGIQYVRNRCTLLYGRKNLVQITDEKGIFKIELLIPQY
jgi:two-component system LytT family sensor kinase